MTFDSDDFSRSFQVTKVKIAVNRCRRSRRINYAEKLFSLSVYLVITLNFASRPTRVMSQCHFQVGGMVEFIGTTVGIAVLTSSCRSKHCFYLNGRHLNLRQSDWLFFRRLRIKKPYTKILAGICSQYALWPYRCAERWAWTCADEVFTHNFPSVVIFRLLAITGLSRLSVRRRKLLARCSRNQESSHVLHSLLQLSI